MTVSYAAEIAGLTTRVLGAERPTLVMVFCHGFGAPGDDLVPIGEQLLSQRPALSERVQFVFPAAPLALSAVPWFESLAWWEIDVDRIQRALEAGDLRSLRREQPPGLPSARRKLARVLDEVARRANLPLGRVALGGFSQGAMLTTDLALRMEEAPAALVALSGVLIQEDDWARFAARRRGLRVLQAHGRQDPVLPFEAGEWLKDLLTEHGLDVTWLPFDGPHTITAPVVDALGDLLEDLAGPS